MRPLIINSMLDNDLYKFTMLQAVLKNFHGTPVKYKFYQRDHTTSYGIRQGFNAAFLGDLRHQIRSMIDLRISTGELEWLKDACPFLDDSLHTYLQNFQFNPGHVQCELSHGQLELKIVGPWEETILWEVPILAIISELYHKHVDSREVDYDDFLTETEHKSAGLRSEQFADFGTRRRRSFETQSDVNKILSHNPNFIGTSNMFFAKKLGLKPIGTMAHEWIMAISALKGLRYANKYALEIWSDTFHGNLGIALSDTFGSESFFRDFNGYLARLYDGVRHDSGEPIEFGNKVIAHYKKLGIDPLSKTIVFSDSLCIPLVNMLHDYFNGQIKTSFGIGTKLTNDFPESPALKIVIKMDECNHIPVVKLSDDEGKAVGNEEALQVANWTFKGSL